jgi:hypothetical protein
MLHSIVILLALGLISLHPTLSGDDDEIPVQAGGSLDYGQVVRAAIDDEIYEVDYRFPGRAGEIVVIEMRSADRSLGNTLIAPMIVLFDQYGEQVSDTALLVPFDDAVLVAEMAFNADYQVRATREYGPFGDSRGEFTISINIVPELSADDGVTGTFSTDDLGMYYFIRAEAPFALHYTRTSGDLTPQLTVNLLNPERGGLEEIATLTGKGLTDGTLGTFSGGQTYIIVLKPPRFEYYFDPVNAEYELRLELR